MAVRSNASPGSLILPATPGAPATEHLHSTRKYTIDFFFFAQPIFLLFVQKLTRTLQYSQSGQDGQQLGECSYELQQLHGGEARTTSQHDH